MKQIKQFFLEGERADLEIARMSIIVHDTYKVRLSIYQYTYGSNQLAEYLMLEDLEHNSGQCFISVLPEEVTFIDLKWVKKNCTELVQYLSLVIVLWESYGFTVFQNFI